MTIEIKNYISLFTGIGLFEVAIKEEFPDAKLEHYSEIDIYAEQTFLKNHPEATSLNLGDIETFCLQFTDESNYIVKEKMIASLPDIDLLVGGSPCQDLSVQKGKDKKGLKGKKSRLFFCFLEILRIKRPKYFILENVATMNTSEKDEITRLISEAVGYEVKPFRMDSALVSPQHRERLYWCNWPVILPEDQGIRLSRNGIPVHAWSKSVRPDGSMDERIRADGIANAITCSVNSTESVNFFPDSPDFTFLPRKVWKREDLFVNQIRPDQKLTINELEGLQMMPKDYTKGLSQNRRVKQIGNGVTVTAIKHLLQELKRGQNEM